MIIPIQILILTYIISGISNYFLLRELHKRQIWNFDPDATELFFIFFPFINFICIFYFLFDLNKSKIKLKKIDMNKFYKLNN